MTIPQYAIHVLIDEYINVVWSMVVFVQYVISLIIMTPNRWQIYGGKGRTSYLAC